MPDKPAPGYEVSWLSRAFDIPIQWVYGSEMLNQIEYQRFTAVQIAFVVDFHIKENTQDCFDCWFPAVFSGFSSNWAIIHPNSCFKEQTKAILNKM